MAAAAVRVATTGRIAVDSCDTVKFVLLNPVDKLEMPLVAVLTAVDRPATVLVTVLTPVDRLATVLVAVLTPVDRSVTVLFVVLKPVDKLVKNPTQRLRRFGCQSQHGSYRATHPMGRHRTPWC